MIPNDIQKIINKLNRIDTKAADYVRHRCLNGDLWRDIRESSDVVGSLFTWSRTPQGWDYWNNIYAQYRNLPNITKLGNRL